MKVLGDIDPTSEQLTIIQDYKPGTMLVRGAAGSGKTSTALFRLKLVSEFWQRRKRDGYVSGPVRILVLTFNRTLRGYIEALAEEKIVGDADLRINDLRQMGDLFSRVSRCTYGRSH